MKSIRTRLTLSYLFLIILTAAVLDTFLIISVRYYYYGSIKKSLKSHAEISESLYSEYAQEDLSANSGELIKVFSNNVQAEVQIVDSGGRVIEDTSSAQRHEKINTADVLSALLGIEGTWEGKNPGTGERVMSAASPLMSGNGITGAVRFISSLTPARSAIMKIIIVVIVFSILVVLLAALAGIFVSQSITDPLRRITDTANSLASGNFDVKIPDIGNDEIGKLADTLKFMVGEIKAREKLKNDFISSISHELRTPLTSIEGWAVTLRSGNLDNKYELMDGLNIIERETGRLIHLVGELLDFSRLQSGRIELKISDTDIKEMLYYIKKQMEPRALRQGIALTIECSGGDMAVKGDESRLRQAFINIVDNSFKFTESGGSIRMSACKDGGAVKVCIEDTGCGIPEDELKRVTEKFYRGSKSSGGAGLGLAISSEIVSLHKGRFIVESTEGKGTRVTIELFA